MRLSFLAAGTLVMACQQDSTPSPAPADVPAAAPVPAAAQAPAVADPLEVSITYCIP